MTVKEYTLIFIFDHSLSSVLLVNKRRGNYPDKWNGIGGKIDPEDHSPRRAAIREMMEETGLTPLSLSSFDPLCFTSYPSGTKLHVYYGVLNEGETFSQLEDEVLFMHAVDTLPNVSSPIWAGEGSPAYFINASLIAIKGRNSGVR